MTIKRLEKIYEGKAKILYATEDPDLMIQYFTGYTYNRYV